MRVKHTIILQVSADSDGKINFYKNDDQLAQEIIDSYDNTVSGSLAIAANTSESVPTGDITAIRGLYLEFDQDAVQVDINGLGAITLAKVGSYAKLFMEAAISSVSVQAPVTVNVTGRYVMWGDLSA